MAVDGCNGLSVHENEGAFTMILELAPPTPKNITALHSLAALKACLGTGREKYGVKDVTCSPTAKSLFFPEHYIGFFFTNQYDPHQALVRTTMKLQAATSKQTWIETDEFRREDYLFTENLSPKDRATIKTVVETNEMLRAISSNPDATSSMIMEKMTQAREACPHHCPLLSLLLFFSVAAMEDSERVKNLAGAVLIDAVEAGRNLVDLIQAKRFCEGNLFSYEPTRNYIRALYLRGSYLYYMGRLEEAYDILQECIANDIHDKLGARHKQLLVVMEMGYIEGKYDERLPNLLRAKFGDDQQIDDVLALWNYTRVLYFFFKEGDSKKSRKLLDHAISKNPFVPPLLLRYESQNRSWAGRKVMQIGQVTEANDYVEDNRRHWKQSTGSLEWLEGVYASHEKAICPKINHAGSKLLSKGNKLFSTRETSDLKRAIVKFKDLLKITEKKEKYSAMRLIALDKIGCCYRFLGDTDQAMQYFKLALASEQDLQNNKDLHKEILYQVASCKEQSGDYKGALDCYQCVFDTFGNFTNALDGVKRIEEKMGCKSGVTPAGIANQPSSLDEEETEEDAEIGDRIGKLISEGLKGIPKERCYHTIERCYHCKRGGVTLSSCSSCNIRYCSRACQTSSWYHIHKYLCKGSKFKIKVGNEIVLKGLSKSPALNGRTGKVVKYSEEKERFVVSLGESGSNILVKPQNIKVVQQA